MLISKLDGLHLILFKPVLVIQDYIIFRGSVTLPVIAEAAAVNGLARKVRPPFP
jgi:hypothetical protein